MLQIEKKCEVLTDNSLRVSLLLPKDLSWFKGHFDIQPILPGVAQIDWAIHYAQLYFASGWSFASLSQVKFLSPILPEDSICLYLEWNEPQLSFYYECLNIAALPKRMSQGKILLCQ